MPRVLVNRLWKHHFDVGLVSTPDNFGVMGEAPSHPELLDRLARTFVREGWSIKKMQRLLVCSRAYRMSSALRDAETERIDPRNRLIHRMNVRRLEAESVRDAILAVSGRLDSAMFGPSVPTHLTEFMNGRGRPGRSGPLDGDGRRSIYLCVRRNFLNTFLLAFDWPAPAAPLGKRNVSNVPAQALRALKRPARSGTIPPLGPANRLRLKLKNRCRTDRSFVPRRVRATCRPSRARRRVGVPPRSQRIASRLGRRSASLGRIVSCADQREGIPLYSLTFWEGRTYALPPLYAAAAFAQGNADSIGQRVRRGRVLGAFRRSRFGALSDAARHDPLAPKNPQFPAKATSVIFFYMDGGPSQMDTFDPKPRLDREHGKPIAVKTHPTQFNNVGNVLKCPWKFRNYGESGIPVSDLFPNVGLCVDDLVIIRSMVSNFSEHTSANYFLHSGSGLQGRPSQGAWVTYGLGSVCADLPGFVVLDGGLIPPGGLDCFGSGFLPASYQGSVSRAAARRSRTSNRAPTKGRSWDFARVGSRGDRPRRQTRRDRSGDRQL